MSSNLERLIVDVKESLGGDLERLFSQMNQRFDEVNARLDAQGALLQTGSRWTNRMNKWSEKIDAALDVHDKQIADLRTRIERLENRGS
jgi:hypothetical protein